MESHPLMRRMTPATGIPYQGRYTKLACGAVLLTEMLERVAFYGALGNFVMFLNMDPLSWAAYNAAIAIFIFTGVSYMTALFGGWLADTILGRFKTICIGFAIYIIGYAFLPFLGYVTEAAKTMNATDIPQALKWCLAEGSQDNSSTRLDDWQLFMFESSDSTTEPPPGRHRFLSMTCDWTVYIAVAVIGVGEGMVKSVIAPFGADQVRHEGPHIMRVFFNWFYWCVNIGALVAFGGMTYIQQEISFFWGYLAPYVCLVLALVAFLIGGPFYIRKTPGGSVLSNICKVLLESCRKKARRGSQQPDEFLCFLSGVEPNPDPPGCLDAAKIRYGGSYPDNIVDDIKVLGRITLIFLILIAYWIAYFQMETTYVIQGLHMRLDFGNASLVESKVFKMPAAWLSLFDIIFLIVLVPVMDRLVYPCLDRNNMQLNLRIRILIGMVFAVLSVVAAGTLEHFRMDLAINNQTLSQIIGKTPYQAADMTILWQIPQYALIGISEVFTSVAGLELAYSEAPRAMQGIIMGLFWFTQGLGSLLGTVIISAFRGLWFFKWDHGNINCHGVIDGQEMDCHLDYYFFFLAGLQVLGIIIYTVVTARIKIGRAKIYHQNSFSRSIEASRSSIDRSYRSVHHPGENVIIDPNIQTRRSPNEIS